MPENDNRMTGGHLVVLLKDDCKLCLRVAGQDFNENRIIRAPLLFPRLVGKLAVIASTQLGKWTNGT